MRFLYVTGVQHWDSHEEQDVANELSVPDAIAYSQTKFVAEAVVRRAVQRSPSETNQFVVFNPGWVIGTPTEGFSNPDDYIWRLAATCINIGAYNAAEADGWLSISDVTATATAIIDTVLSKETKRVNGKEPVNGMTWRELWGILESLEWLALIRADIEAAKKKHPLWPLAHMITGFQNDERMVGSSRQKRGSTPLRFKDAVKRSAEFLVKAGFLPTPSEQV
ncbi:uncharacterized protein N7487_003924 [Penicillium crustosum]|uniref:uncharacterized protein n=1 Tax=Penicillium crustosum TaxID=36656 RepID=UPI0023927662|nr:uncharacterized protein N7487_003924 [Penicillium crustosum]KAJ5409565.1 hypothetical protein N7487_003924 [Penicillium crustosum]